MTYEEIAKMLEAASPFGEDAIEALLGAAIDLGHSALRAKNRRLYQVSQEDQLFKLVIE